MNPFARPPTQPGRAVARLFTIRSYLLIMVAVILLPMMVLVAVLAWDYGMAGRRTIEAERLDAASNLLHLMDREIGETKGFLDGLATSLAQRPSEPRIADSAVIAALSHGFEVLAVHDRTSRPLFVAPTTVDTSVVSARKLGVAEVVAGHKPFVSDFVPGKGTYTPGLFFVSVPVTVGGQVALVLSGGLPVSRLQPLLSEAGLRPGWLAAIVDRDGVVLARRDRPDLYVGGPAQKPMIEIARAGRTSGLFDVVSRDGIDVKNAFQRSAVSGWTAAVAVPAAVVDAPLHRTAATMAAIGVALMLVSLLLGALVASRISRAVQQLGMASAAFASGHAVPLPTSMLTELQDVADVLEVAAERARRREAMAREVLREPGAGY